MEKTRPARSLAPMTQAGAIRRATGTLASPSNNPNLSLLRLGSKSRVMTNKAVMVARVKQLSGPIFRPGQLKARRSVHPSAPFKVGA